MTDTPFAYRILKIFVGVRTRKQIVFHVFSRCPRDLRILGLIMSKRQSLITVVMGRVWLIVSVLDPAASKSSRLTQQRRLFETK